MTDSFSFVAPLFVPANRPDRFGKAARSGADATIVDLEDAVAPPDKESARRALMESPPGGSVIVRINAYGTPWHDDDVEALARLPSTGVMVPKAEDPARLDDLAGRLGSARPIVPLIETARGIHDVVAIAAVAGVIQLAFGPVDLCNDLDCGDTRDALLAARSAMVLASRLARLPAPLDGPTLDFGSDTRTADDARYARSLGFGGKLCIHPGQVAAVKLAFSPSEADVAWAENVLAAAGSGGVSATGGHMIDAPLVDRAHRILARRSGQ